MAILKKINWKQHDLEWESGICYDLQTCPLALCIQPAACTEVKCQSPVCSGPGAS